MRHTQLMDFNNCVSQREYFEVVFLQNVTEFAHRALVYKNVHVRFSKASRDFPDIFYASSWSPPIGRKIDRVISKRCWFPENGWSSSWRQYLHTTCLVNRWNAQRVFVIKISDKNISSSSRIFVHTGKVILTLMHVYIFFLKFNLSQMFSRKERRRPHSADVSYLFSGTTESTLTTTATHLWVPKPVSLDPDSKVSSLPNAIHTPFLHAVAFISQF